MNPWHLVWIIPVSMAAGAALLILVALAALRAMDDD